jgi:probable addiction module antidote protein
LKGSPNRSAFDAAKYCDNSAANAEYLNDALATGDVVRIKKAIGDMVRAQGGTRFARKARLRRETLYRAFDGKNNPGFDFVIDVLIALDVQLKVTGELTEGEVKRVGRNR